MSRATLTAFLLTAFLLALSAFAWAQTPIDGPVLWTYRLGKWTMRDVYASNTDCAIKRDAIAPSPERATAILVGVDTAEQRLRIQRATIGLVGGAAAKAELAARAGFESFAQLEAAANGGPVPEAAKEALGLIAVGRCLPVGVSPG